ncbi:MAG: PepSY domain-containing protein [Gordonia sp. (in: high G+C Gram-positive bacteria)]|uniref:PepSY domain-containing protein n=1 Tax=Gordonia sp. (in: high G+C Gram-positive bacteria) TaxID=84139 RepID=UPI003C740E6D
MQTRKHVLTVVAVAAVGAVPLLSACSNDGSEAGKTSAPATVTVTESGHTGPSASPTTTPNGSKVDLATAGVAVDWRRALDIAGRQFGGKPVAVKLEVKPAAAPQYEVTLVSDTQEAEIDIDANIGEVVGKNIDPIEHDVLPGKGEPLVLVGLIEPDAAIAAAVKALPGPVSEWKLKRQGAQIVYVVDVDNPQDDGDVTVDAKTGAVLSVDH